MQEKILFDLDNAPQIPAAIPIAEALAKMGHQVLFSVKNRSRAWELMQLHNRQFFKFKDSEHSHIAGKAISTISRALSLTHLIKKHKITRAVGLGSRSLPIAAWMTGIPSITIIDYEWVNTTIYNKFSTTILLPEVITIQNCEKANINTQKVKHFPGIRQNIYINSKATEEETERKIKTNHIIKQLNIDPTKTNILLRPPATKAHYHNTNTQLAYEKAINQLLKQKNTDLYCIARAKEKEPRIKQITQVFNGIELISSFSAIVGAGGTMTREAAALGIPSYTCFKGPMGMVDQYLINQQRLFEPPNDPIPNYKPLPILTLSINPLPIITEAILNS